MLKWTSLPTMIFAASLVAGCTATTSGGVGYSPIVLKPKTAAAITKGGTIEPDLRAARGIAAHNRQCAKDKGCV